ncbi:hypothetical protein YC2023_088304 [Brassica napus]
MFPACFRWVLFSSDEDLIGEDGGSLRLSSGGGSMEEELCRIRSSPTKSSQNQPRERSLHLLRLGGRVCGPGEAKLPSDHIVEGEPNRLERSRDRSYSVFVYLGVEEQKVLKCDRVNQRGSHNKIHHTEEDLARGIIPPLPQEDTDDDVADSTPTEVEVVEISDEEEEEEDMVELSFEEYMRNMGYLIRVEESVEDIEPEFRRMLKRMEQEEKKLREEKFKVLNSGIKLEVGQSSKGDGKKRKRRS